LAKLPDFCIVGAGVVGQYSMLDRLPFLPPTWSGASLSPAPPRIFPDAP
jgi:hypothetical protein